MWNNNQDLPVGKTVLVQLNGGDYVCLTYQDKSHKDALFYILVDESYGYNDKTTICFSLNSIKRWCEIVE